MAKTKSSYKPEVKVREATPRVKEDVNAPALLCPFCEIPHPISIGQDAICGTTLRVTAVQTIYPARTVHKHSLLCIKCGKGDGEMIRFNQGYIHLKECAPNTKLMAEVPPFSKYAEWVYQLPPALRKPIEKRWGYAKQVKELDPHGADTGKVLGYFFFKGD